MSLRACTVLRSVFLFWVACLLTFSLLGGNRSFADELPEYWQLQRDFINQLGNQACRGSKSDYERIMGLAVVEDDPVAKNQLGWIQVSPACTDYGLSDARMRELVREAATQSYPIAQFNLGRYLLRRHGGNDVRRQEALCWIYRSIEGGYGVGAEYLSRHYLLGGEVVHNLVLSRGFYRIARAENVQREGMARLAQAHPSTQVSIEENSRFLAERLEECADLLS